MRPHTRHFIRLLAVFAVSLGLLATGVQNSSALDVYTTPGKHSQNGRDWLTTCEKYSSKVDRCTTRIWAAVVAPTKSGTFTSAKQWAFNNLTYKTSSRAIWDRWNPLVTPGGHTVDGRRWKTECDTAWTGSNGCRSQIWATVPEYKNGKYTMVNKWVFNNIVHVTPIPCPVTQSFIRKVTAQPTIVTSACTVSKTHPSWLAVEYVASSRSGGLYVETAFLAKRTGGWAFEAKGSADTTSICAWWEENRPPLDLADTIPYCFKG
ncbi:MAG: hypothetical protein ABIS84_12880 [Arachnia sp.]